MNMHPNPKISSKQIIILILAFLIGVGVALLITRDKAELTPAEDGITQEDAIDSEETTSTDETSSVSPSDNQTNTKSAGKTAPSTTKSTYQPVTGKCYTSLSARKDIKLNGIVLSWSPCASDDFQFYKLVKSSKNSSPSYPADGVAYSSANRNASSFLDKTVAQRTTYYYRMCVVQRLNAINCSNVATVSF